MAKESQAKSRRQKQVRPARATKTTARKSPTQRAAKKTVPLKIADAVETTDSELAQRRNFVFKMELTIPARSESISPLVESVLAVVRETGIGKELEIETALREALANAVKHGCHNDPKNFVQCCVAFEEGGSVLIVVSDPGPGFNPDALPDPTTGEHLFEDHGRGIFLINRLMDEVRFERNGAEIHMRKY